MAVGFSPKDARRVAKTVQRVESTPWSPQTARVPVNTFNPGVMRAKCTTAIPAGTFDSPSDTGEVQIYHRDRTGAWVESGDPVQCFNDYDFGDDVAVGDACRVSWIDGQIWYENSSCPPPPEE